MRARSFSYGSAGRIGGLLADRLHDRFRLIGSTDDQASSAEPWQTSEIPLLYRVRVTELMRLCISQAQAA